MGTAVADVAGANRRQGLVQPPRRVAPGPGPRRTERQELSGGVLIALLLAADLLRRPVVEDGAVRQELHGAGGRTAGVQGVRRRIDRPDVPGHDQESGGGPPRHRVGERDDTAHSPGRAGRSKQRARNQLAVLPGHSSSRTKREHSTDSVKGRSSGSGLVRTAVFTRYSERGDAVEPAAAVGGVVRGRTAPSPRDRNGSSGGRAQTPCRALRRG